MRSRPPAERDYVMFSQEFCPQAVVECYKLEADERAIKTQFKMSDVRAKARGHLLAAGWKFWRGQKKNKLELRYTAPSGKCYYSLRTACKACIDGQGEGIGLGGLVLSRESVDSSTGPTCTTPPAMGAIDDQEGALVLRPEVKVEGCLFPGKIDGFNGIGQESLSLTPPSAALSSESVKAHEEIPHLDDTPQKDVARIGSVSVVKPRFSKSVRAGKVVKDLKKLGGGHSCPDDRKRKRHVTTTATTTGSKNVGNKRVRKVVPNRRNPRTILSSLIENCVVSAGARVHYRGKSCSGAILPEGIKCHCCSRVFFLTAFEAHAGSTNHRPAANILLDDGRSLLDCQRQAKTHAAKNVDDRQTTRTISAGGVVEDENDDVCAVCHYGGELVLCDTCPSAYHVSCLGLKGPPHPSDGDWFCPPCRCGSCGGGYFGEASGSYGSLVCHQCERKYHFACCVKGVFGSRERPFCSEKCQNVCLGLEKILGKRIPVGDNGNGLTWKLLKATNPDQTAKLGVALSVMHECFEPAKDSLTNRDIVEDVIFCRESELKRLNFRGFYVVVLEQIDEMVSVAVVRIFGDKLAEVPLVATQFQYRRMGMCGVLIAELEKQLGDLGVKRLTLPAASGVLQTWTSSFGFSTMSEDEKLELLDYNLLDFQDTIMCQKLLKKTSVEESRPLKRDLASDFLSGYSSITAEHFDSQSRLVNAGAISWSTIYG
ncbi:Acyl-CoA N-acyltransferase [Parasponia andersonii]|uniref:Acyl-CoA N-acyltransferase n=1 Tax=Parasponia andersonii TaxID=3476 RepID=A0A2P5DI67_PARAD|nr:Acyl-CoA N-acyltransferase [Parasponia andersonii]